MRGWKSSAQRTAIAQGARTRPPEAEQVLGSANAILRFGRASIDRQESLAYIANQREITAWPLVTLF